MRGGPHHEQRSTPKRIALLDGDSGFVGALANRLGRVGWAYQTLSAPIATDAVLELSLDALVVDLAMLGPEAWDWLGSLCKARAGFAIVVCTRSSTLAERVRALRLGADDWLGKPCHPEELIARIEAVVRQLRRWSTVDSGSVRVGEVEIRTDQYQAFADGRSLNLTRRELQMLLLMAQSAGQVLEREVVYERLWGYKMLRDERSVDVLVYKLRRKLDAGSPRWRYIHTHAGIGYSFAPEPIAPSEIPSELERRGARAERERREAQVERELRGAQDKRPLAA
jgi:DNA-binding response OmpR family regulator